MWAFRVMMTVTWHLSGCLTQRCPGPVWSRYFAVGLETFAMSEVMSRPLLRFAQRRFQSTRKPSDAEVENTVPSITAVRT